MTKLNRKKTALTLKIQHLDTKEKMLNAFDLIHSHYQNLDFDEFSSNLDEMIKTSDYKMFAAFLNGKMIGVCGYSILFMFYCKRYLQISNLIIDEKFRGKKIGSKMMDFMENFAVKKQCNKFVLDSYTENKKSHSFYYEKGFYIRGYHFMKDLDEN